ncbi:hypothetical protein EV424DRAFT_1349194 [Suillus variegatus]|nr:hypothetical protein EV424DRAFT_1349194 [Suillus variegatus]
MDFMAVVDKNLIYLIGCVSSIIHIPTLLYIEATMMDSIKESPYYVGYIIDALKARIDFVDSTINDCHASDWAKQLLLIGAYFSLLDFTFLTLSKNLSYVDEEGLGFFGLFKSAYAGYM